MPSSSSQFAAHAFSLRLKSARRWVGLLVISLALHVLTFQVFLSKRIDRWNNGHDSGHAASNPVVSTLTLTAPLFKKIPGDPPHIHPQPVSKRTASHSLVHPMAQAENTRSLPIAASKTRQASVQEAIQESIANAAMTFAPPAPDPVATSVRLKIFAPVTLHYRVAARKKNQLQEGRATLAWTVSAEHYAVHHALQLGDANAWWSSAGLIDRNGLYPIEFAQKTFHQSEVATHFNRAQATISFSRVTQSVPLEQNAQDKISWIWQIAMMGNADPLQLREGAVLALQLASTTDVAPWNLQVMGAEELAWNGAMQTTLRVLHAPATDTYDQRIEVWYAPQLNWYPLRLRYVDANGDVMDWWLDAFERNES